MLKLLSENIYEILITVHFSDVIWVCFLVIISISYNYIVKNYLLCILFLQWCIRRLIANVGGIHYSIQTIFTLPSWGLKCIVPA